MHEGGGNCVKYFKSGWNRKEVRGNKDFEKWGKLGHKVGALKGGAGTPLRTMHNNHYTAYYPTGKGLFNVNKITKEHRPSRLCSNVIY